MIELIPAIDLIDGKCVRLTKGDYNSSKVYAEDPVAQAQEFERLGFKRLHVVDLDGARSAHVVNIKTLRALTKATNLRIDFGGGIKTADDVRQVMDAGAAMATIGSVAVTRPELFEQWLKAYGADRIILGADVRGDKIAIKGWLEDSDLTLTDFIKRYTDMGVTNVLCTDISRDGTLQGPATERYKQLMQRFPQLHLIASGGVSGTNDIISLQQAGIPAVVFGKAWYEGRIDLEKLKGGLQ